jgi:hypothetical protein
MTEGPVDECGIRVDPNGSITFVVQRYFRDFRSGLTEYKEDLLARQDHSLLDAISRIPMHNI